MLACTELLAPARELLRAMLTATLSVGSFSVSLGDVLAFAVTIWLSFLLSRFIRFVLEEDVYPRVRPGARPALRVLDHPALRRSCCSASWSRLAAAGMQLDRFALLAGAFGVGIGFGLQNVVNNFVSGLILLFERPLQVGDTVEIGSISGEISRIGIRSSTVRTGQGAEVIVPNATPDLRSGGQLDAVGSHAAHRHRRRRFRYGTDPEHGDRDPAQRRHHAPAGGRVAAAHALVVGFGDAMLNFELRAWTDRFDQWVSIRSELAWRSHGVRRGGNPHAALTAHGASASAPADRR